MNLVRAVLGDLVEKRLWPIALLLAITAVAVPVVLGRGGTGAADAPVATQPAAAAGGAASATPVVEIVGPASARSRPGTERDPFRRATPAAAATATADGAPAPAPAQAGSTAASSPKRAAAAAPAAASATTAKPATAAPAAARRQPRPAATAATVYRTRVRWNHNDDDKARVRGVSRLQPLGGRSDPALLYLGTTTRHRAVFLLGPNASANGESTCAEKTCRVIKLKAGARTVVSVEDEEGGAARRYTLVIDRIVRRHVAGKAAAAKLRARVYGGGRDVLREIIKDKQTAAAIGRFGFDHSLGAVVVTNAP
ncbi:MAG TPA: hypothetical protein VGC59_16920 [Solirubrobacteraceae bacterium]